jgi:hypothetical protein
VASALRAFAQEPLVVQTSEDLITRVWDARTLQIVSRLPRTRHFAVRGVRRSLSHFSAAETHSSAPHLTLTTACLRCIS